MEPELRGPQLGDWVKRGWRGGSAAEVYGSVQMVTRPGEEGTRQEDTLLKGWRGSGWGSDEGLAARGRVDHREPDWHWGPWLGHVTWEGTEAAPLCPVGLSQRPSSAKPRFPGQSRGERRCTRRSSDTEDKKAEERKAGGRSRVSSTCGPRGCG